MNILLEIEMVAYFISILLFFLIGMPIAFAMGTAHWWHLGFLGVKYR
ncbi:MAG: hypothetical protein CM1200mP10_08620 [Candidatus Neomarinimicrobiota bacterium]|nr:MAG: hypothetical protein CM1200mP10_08620 [Candidatus Neomarinimicrobiota bacterium]